MTKSHMVIGLYLYDSKFVARDYDISVKKAECVWQYIPPQLSYSMQLWLLCAVFQVEMSRVCPWASATFTVNVRCHLSWRYIISTQQGQKLNRAPGNMLPN